MDSYEDGSRISLNGTVNATIQPGNTVIIKLPNGEKKGVVLELDAYITLGKYGGFYSNELFNHPFGWSYEINDKTLRVVPPRDIQGLEDTDATNELIFESDNVQPLTVVDIESLKQAGVHASDIIQKQIEQHANYELKTEYSKEKYKMRKEAKWVPIAIVEPTIFNICEYWYQKDQNRLRDIRPDTLSQMLNMVNARPGGRYIVVDDASGMVVAAVLDRMGGSGKLLTICDVESPPTYPILSYMNLEQQSINSVMDSLNWANADKCHSPVLLPSEPELGEYKSDRQRARLSKRRSVTERLLKTRDELFAGGFEGLLVASNHDPFSTVDALSTYIAASSSVVVQSPYLTVLVDLQAKLRALPEYLGASITEGWLRQYQVLPGRTHPTMSTAGSGGFLLHAIKVFDNPEATSVLIPRQRSKK